MKKFPLPYLFRLCAVLGLGLIISVSMLSGDNDEDDESEGSGKSVRYVLSTASAETGSAVVHIKGKQLKIFIRGATPNSLYTVWVDFRKSGVVPSGFPSGAIPVAPAIAAAAGVTSGVGLDDNGIITDRRGNANWSLRLDYELLKPNDSPVVGSLAMQGLNIVGGGWMRKYPVPPAAAASVQLVDPATGLPLLERATAQGITIVRHPDFITHGHSPGVGGVDHFSAFKGDFPGL